MVTSVVKLFFVLLALVFFKNGSLAFTKEPERTIELSIYDLVHKRGEVQRENVVDRAYVESVLSQLKDHQTQILACFKVGTSLNSTFRLKISKDGTAQVTTPTENPIDGCTREALKRILYPKHTYKGPVEIEIPMQIQKQTL